MNQENKTPHNFCETPEEKCTMNYCDENGCQNRKRRLVSENKQLPTASQSLYKWNFKLVHEDMAKCIDEHTRLHTAPLREELEKLRAWKESAMKTLADVDLQECGKLLNVGLGQSISDKIVPGIKELKAENERLRADNLKLKSDTDRRIKGYNDLHDDLIGYRDKYDQSVQDLDELKAENQKLREALGQVNAVIANEDYYMDWSKTTNEIENIVLGALKGLGQ